MKFILSLLIGVDIDREEKTDLQWKNLSGFHFSLIVTIWVYLKQYDLIYSLPTLGVWGAILLYFIFSGISVLAFRKMNRSAAVSLACIVTLAFAIACWDDVKEDIPLISSVLKQQ